MKNRLTRLVLGVAALAALALGGSALAGAASSGTTGQSGSTTKPPAFNGPAHGTAAHEGSEATVTGDAATKVKAAAVADAGGGTAGDVTYNYDKSGYEVTVTKADGSTTEVHVSLAFKAEQGFGPGGPGGGPGDDDAPAAGTQGTGA